MHSLNFSLAAKAVIDNLDHAKIESLAKELSHLKGRLFILGVGGSAANASHAVNDFRKLCEIEAYAPTDNVAELTARTNDEGWKTTFSEWLRVSRLAIPDALLILSVGGGTPESSANIIEAINYAKKVEANVYAIVGRANGYAGENADIAIVIPSVEEKWTTPLSEAFQMVVLHCLVSHPALQVNQTKW